VLFIVCWSRSTRPFEVGLPARIRRCSTLPLARAQADRAERELVQYLGYYNFDRAHTGRLTRGRIPGEIVYGARKVRTAR
jgi:cob(I)alamin adenosyltransferase